MKPREKQEEVGAEQEKVRKNKEKFDEMVWDIVKRREEGGGVNRGVRIDRGGGSFTPGRATAINSVS